MIMQVTDIHKKKFVFFSLCRQRNIFVKSWKQKCKAKRYLHGFASVPH